MINTSSGRSMIEMMGVLTIIGALSVGGIAGYTKVMHQNKIKMSVEQISVISSHLSAIGANGGNYEGLNNKTAIKLKAVLPEMISGSESLKNPFGGEVEIKSGTLTSEGGHGLAYTIEYKGLDKQACIALATHDWGSAKNSSLIGVAAGKTGSVLSDVNSLHLNCSGRMSAHHVIACTNGSLYKTPIPMNVAASGAVCLECGSNICSVILKYF